MARKEQLRGVESRRRIIEAAAAEFEASGFESTTLAAIAERSGVSKGAMYWHFSTKEEIASAIIDLEQDVARRIREQYRSPGPDVMGAIVDCSLDLCYLILTNPVVRAGMQLSLEEQTFAKPRIAPYQEWKYFFESLIHRAIGHGAIVDSVDAGSLAHYWVASFTGHQVLAGVFGESEMLRNRLADAWGYVLPAIVPDDQRSEIARLVQRFRDAAHVPEFAQATGSTGVDGAPA